jgi:type I restriction enzyme, S subunit
MSEQALELPKGWVETKIGDIITSVKGKKPKILVKTISKNNFPYINIKAFEKKIFDEYTNDESCPRCTEKDLLMVWDGSRSGLVGFGVSGVIGSTIAKIDCHENNSKFLWYFLYSKYRILNTKQRGTGTPHVDPNILMNFKFLLPSLNEQKRIVLKIDELFSKIDSSKQSLEHTKLQLEQYGNSLLKSAFEGKLTKGWRKKENPSLDILLEKIQLNRKNQESKLQKLKPLYDDAPFAIPSDWTWTRVGIISNEIQYGTSEKATTTKSKLPVLRMGNIQDGVLNFEKLKYYPDNWNGREKYLLKDGDVLFNRTNSAELVGKSAIYRESHPPAVFAGYLIRVKILNEIYRPLLLTWYLNSIFGKLYVKSVVTQQVGQANVNGTKLAMMLIPLMSNEEQKEIIAIIEQGFSLIQNINQIITSRLSSLQTIKISILKQAFNGKLVPQDPNDEPAQILLDKIKSTKGSQPKKQRRSKNVK